MKLIWKVIYMTFNIPPPLNITILFEKWLNGVEKTSKAHIKLKCVLCCGQYGTCAIIAFKKSKLSTYGYPLDPYMVLSACQRRSA
jgi:hypothetical protein